MSFLSLDIILVESTNGEAQGLFARHYMLLFIYAVMLFFVPLGIFSHLNGESLLFS
jgi:hypothetical protein